MMMMLFFFALSSRPVRAALFLSLLAFSFPPSLPGAQRTRRDLRAHRKRKPRNRLTSATAGSANDDAAGPLLALPLGPAAPLPPPPPRASIRACPPASAPTACARGRASGAEASRQDRSSGGSMVERVFFFPFFDRRVFFFFLRREVFSTSPHFRALLPLEELSQLSLSLSLDFFFAPQLERS